MQHLPEKLVRNDCRIAAHGRRKFLASRSWDHAGFTAVDSAPEHNRRHRHRGVSDSAEGPRGRLCEAQAGSLTPLLCTDTCARALTGRHKTPPDHDGCAPCKGPAVHALSARELPLPRLHGPGRDADAATGERGQPRSDAASPSSARCQIEAPADVCTEGRYAVIKPIPRRPCGRRSTTMR